MDEKAPKIDDKKFAAHMNKNKKTKTMNSTRKSLASIRQRADSIVKSKKSTASMRNSAGLRTREGVENMCCKNCGDMYGKPTKENKSCMYDAYNREGKNWIKKESYREAVITPKMQKRALASPAAKAKPKSQVSLKKAPFKIPSKDDMKEMIESFDFRVNIDGFPEMFMSGNSPSEVKTNLRKLVKQPSMIQSVDRVTKADKKKHHRDKVKESLDESSKTVQSMMKIVDKKQAMKIDGVMVDMFTASAVTQIYNKVNDANKSKMDKMRAPQLANVAMKLLKKESLDEGMNEDPCWDTHKQVGMKKKGNKMVPNCVPKNEDNVDELSMSRKDVTKSGIRKIDTSKIKKDLEKLKQGLKKKEAVSPAQQAAIAISKKEKSKNEGGMKRMSTGDGMSTFKKKPPEKESYAPDEGTPEAKKKASKMTPGQTGQENFFKNLGNKIMGNKPTANQTRQRVNTNKGSTSGRQNSVASRINFGGKYGNK